MNNSSAKENIQWNHKNKVNLFNQIKISGQKPKINVNLYSHHL